jgi:exonuclease SbcC
MITNVKLQNWRSHLNTDLKFSEGTNCFIGPMGAGKTSILDGICFALFGTFPQLQQKKLKLEDMIMKKPKKQNEASIEMGFQLGNDSYTVKRTIARGKTSAELRKGNNLIQAQTSKVTEEIERLLKVDYDLFTRAIYSEQNQLDHFLTIPKGQRMKKIDELLAIDKFETARATVKSMTNKCNLAIEEKKKLTENMELDESLKRIDLVKNEIMKVKLDERGLKEKIKVVLEQKDRMHKDISFLKDQQQIIQKINEELRATSTLLQENQKDIESLKEGLMEFAEKTTEDLEADLAKYQEKIIELKTNLENEREELDKLKDSYAEKEAQVRLIETEKIPELKELTQQRGKMTAELKKYPVNKLAESINDRQRKLEDDKAELQKSFARIDDLRAGLEELKIVGDVCPICDNKLSDKKKQTIISKKEKTLDDLKKKCKKLEVNIEEFDSEIGELKKRLKISERLEDKLADMKNVNKEFKSLSEKLRVYRNEIKGFDKQKRMFEKTTDMIQKNLDGLSSEQEKIRLMITKRVEIKNKTDRINKLNQRVDELRIEKEKYSQFSPTKLELMENEFQNFIALENQIITRLENINSIIFEKQKLLNEIENKKKVLDQYKVDIEKIQFYAQQLQLLEIALINTQEQLRKNFVSAVNQAMQSIWTELYPYKDIYSIRLGIQEGDYVLQLQDSTGWIPADGAASGGERAMACLDLRIAFALVLAPQLKWLVLDEPTHNLDARAVEELAAVLRDRVSVLVDQIFLITHDPSLETAVSGFLYRVDREKEKDGYTKVNLIAGPEL